ncbi:hypothetical protein QBC47DRAFT_86442 [Echria macrotheca]|uniref:Uncharacterized protein n=1 Tax=Echria macrotheca TaxID=438768 RepID=A0AAJ0F5C6_9PEZI|nr:hypothetical protein QBC47DRAFT_86442 [Echria macrotheca]
MLQPYPAWPPSSLLGSASPDTNSTAREPRAIFAKERANKVGGVWKSYGTGSANAATCRNRTFTIAPIRVQPCCRLVSCSSPATSRPPPGLSRLHPSANLVRPDGARTVQFPTRSPRKRPMITCPSPTSKDVGGRAACGLRTTPSCPVFPDCGPGTSSPPVIITSRSRLSTPEQKSMAYSPAPSRPQQSQGARFTHHRNIR